MKSILILFALLTNTQLFAQATGGNGETPTDKAFRAAKITAPYWIEKIALDTTPFDADRTSFQTFPVLKKILQSNDMLQRLASDIRSSPHIYDTNAYPVGHIGHDHCAFTNNPQETSLDVIRIFIPVCAPYLEGDAENRAIKTLIHESMHHMVRLIKASAELSAAYPIQFSGNAEQQYEQEEQFCDSAADAIDKAWERINQMELPDKFEINANNAPEARGYHSAAWTGETGDDQTKNRMIVWGGCNNSGALADCGKYFQDGGIYDVQHETWETFLNQTTVMPTARAHQASVWIDSSEKEKVKNGLLIWSGCGRDQGCSEVYDDGFIYRIKQKSWEKISRAPISGRTKAVQVWTGKEFIVWGGEAVNEHNERISKNDGAAYNPDTNSWRMIKPVNLPPTIYARAVWTGKKMIVYGGCAMASVLVSCDHVSNKIGFYDPKSDTWETSDSSTVGAGREGRFLHSMVYIPQLDQIWIHGGQNQSGFLGDGLLFNLKDNTWQNLPESGSSRSRHVSLWTGRNLITFGGVTQTLSNYKLDMMALNLDASSRFRWENLITSDGTLGVRGQSALWTGSFILEFGGQKDDRAFSDKGFVYKPRGFVAPLLDR